MSQLTKETLLKRLFHDPKNYPYGFSRSGDFSISESKALSEYGCLFAALVDGHYAPTDAEDKQFLNAALGHVDPASVQERAWVKYQKRINRPKTGSIYGSRPVANVEDDEVDSSDELDLDLES
ncbi:DUF413 domain-containing protein [Glaciecola sp. 1036]|uniref:DUF413 domain-containing protein n=1 Tax=Alteromonadaceae TaxID=72275 RepID=UPI003D04CD0B